MSETMAERLHADMIAAMKAREKEKLGVLRMLNAAVKDAAIEKRAPLGDDEVLRLLMSYAKKREEAKAEAETASRPELAAKEAFEITVVKAYLPEALGEEELELLVKDVVGELKATSMREMGAVMKLCQERAQGRADGRRISEVVRRQLGA